MVNLTRASRELFSRTPDERFDSFDALLAHCQEAKVRGNRALATFARHLASSKTQVSSSCGWTKRRM